MNIKFLHFHNLCFFGYIRCNFRLIPHIIHGDMRENVSGCFFSVHRVLPINMWFRVHTCQRKLTKEVC